MSEEEGSSGIPKPFLQKPKIFKEEKPRAGVETPAVTAKETLSPAKTTDPLTRLIDSLKMTEEEKKELDNLSIQKKFYVFLVTMDWLKKLDETKSLLAGRPTEAPSSWRTVQTTQPSTQTQTPQTGEKEEPSSGLTIFDDETRRAFDRAAEEELKKFGKPLPTISLRGVGEGGRGGFDLLSLILGFTSGEEFKKFSNKLWGMLNKMFKVE